MRSDYSPLETIQYAVRHAWLVMGLMLFGGLAGWAVFRASPAVYEARIVYSFSVDFAQTGILSDIELDHAMDAAGDLLWSDDVLRNAANALDSHDIALEAAQLRALAVKERTNNDWIIRVRYSDAQQAAQIANAWGDAAGQTMTEAYAHALRAQNILRYLDSIETCLGRSVSSEPVQAFCSNENLAEIQAKFDESSSELERETHASLGLFPGLRYVWAEKAAPPTSRMNGGQGLSILAGALIGWMAAILAAQIHLPDRLRRKSRRV